MEGDAMTEVEERVRRIAQEYLRVFVNTQWMLKDTETHRKTYQHMRDWIAMHYRAEHKPSDMEWNMTGLNRQVTEVVKSVVNELVEAKR